MQNKKRVKNQHSSWDGNNMASMWIPLEEKEAIEKKKQDE